MTKNSRQTVTNVRPLSADTECHWKLSSLKEYGFLELLEHICPNYRSFHNALIFMHTIVEMITDSVVFKMWVLQFSGVYLSVSGSNVTVTKCDGFGL